MDQNLRVVSVVRLPQVFFAEDQRWRDGCMMPPITLTRRVKRQVFPHRTPLNCCYYHRQDLHAVGRVVVDLYQQLRRQRLEGEQADDHVVRSLATSSLGKDERSTAEMMLTEGCGIQIYRARGELRFSYQEGRHRARAFMDAGVRRIVAAVEDERWFWG